MTECLVFKRITQNTISHKGRKKGRNYEPGRRVINGIFWYVVVVSLNSTREIAAERRN